MSNELQKKLDHVPVFGLHAKSMVIDGKTTVIGTFNLDPRSANLNTECATIMYSSKIAKNLHKIMEEEKNLTEVSKEKEVKKESVFMLPIRNVDCRL